MADQTSEFKVRVSAQLGDLRQSLEQVSARLDAIGKAGKTAGDQATKAFEATRRAADSIEQGPAVVDQAAVQRQALRIQQEELTEARQRGLVTEQEYARQRAAIQQAGLDVELKQLESALSKEATLERRSQLVTQQALVKQRQDATARSRSTADALQGTGTVDQVAVLRESLRIQQTELDQAHSRGLVSERQYRRQRAAIQQRALQVEIAQQRAALQASTTVDQRSQALTQIAVLEQRLGGAQRASAAAARITNALGASLNRAAKGALSLAAAYAALRAGTVFVQRADEAKLLAARVRLVTESEAELAAVQGQLFAVSQGTRSGLSETTNLYTQLARSTKELGTSQAETLRVTETINKAIQVSGTSAQASEAAIIQLGQGLASGALRGDELRSVLEQTPRLAQAIADGMGRTVGELRELGSEGKISAEAVVNALLSQTDVIDAEFSKLPKTVGGAVTQVGNSLTKAIERIEAASGASGGLAESLESLAEYLASGEFADAAITGIGPISAAIGGIGDDIEEAFGRSTTQLVVDLFATAGNYLGRFIAFFRLSVKATTVELVAAADLVSEAWKGAFDWAKAWINGENTDAIAANWERAKARIDRSLRSSLTDFVGEYEAAVSAGQSKAVEDAGEVSDQPRAPRRRRARAGGGAGSDPGDASADYTEVYKQGLEQQQADLERAHERALLSDREFFEQRAALQLEALDLEAVQRQSALQKLEATNKGGKNNEAIGRELTQLALLEGEREAIAKRTNEAIEDAQEAHSAELRSLRVAELEATGRTVEAQLAEVEEKYREARARMLANNDTEGVTLVDSLIGYERGKVQLEQIKADIAAAQKLPTADAIAQLEQYRSKLEELPPATLGAAEALRELNQSISDTQLNDIGEGVDAAIARFRAAEQSAANSIDTGTSQGVAFDEVRQAASQALPQLQEYRRELQELAPTSTEAADKLREVDGAIADIERRAQSGVARAVGDLRRELAGLQASLQSDIGFALRDSLKGLFEDIATGSKNAGEAVGDFAKSFAKSVISIIANILATKAAMALLDTAGGLFGGLFGGGGASAAVHHTGGVAGSGLQTRTVSPILFAAAPRYHSGGIAGLKADEVPAILQRGEEVLTRDDPRHRANAEPGQGGTVRHIHELRADRDLIQATFGDWFNSYVSDAMARS